MPCRRESGGPANKTPGREPWNAGRGEERALRYELVVGIRRVVHGAGSYLCYNLNFQKPRCTERCGGLLPA